MNNFVEDYPGTESRTIAAAKAEVDNRQWFDQVDEEEVYRQLSSPEYKLYLEMVLSDSMEESSNVYNYL